MQNQARLIYTVFEMNYILAFIFGAAFGSFSLVLAWRMHDKKDWVKGRSKCDSCGHELSPADLIPIYSWLRLRGKCRYCRKPIPATLILAEAWLGTVFTLSYAYWPYALSGVADYLLLFVWLFCCVIFSALFWYDARWYILPNKLVYPLGYSSVIFVALRYVVVDGRLYNDLLLPVLSATLLFGLFYMLNAVSKGKWIGYGDVRLAVPLGLLVSSPVLAWLMLFVASMIGIVIALPSLAQGKKSLKSKLPFGPMLIMATVIVVLFGNDMIQFYLDNFLRIN